MVIKMKFRYGVLDLIINIGLCLKIIIKEKMIFILQQKTKRAFYESNFNKCPNF